MRYSHRSSSVSRTNDRVPSHPSSKPVPVQCSRIPSHRNNLFPHQRKEVGHPVIGSVDDMFGANVAARGVDDVVDGETGWVRVQQE